MLGLIVAFAIVVYVYRQVIMTTIIDAVLAAVGVALFIGGVALSISAFRWYRRQHRALKAEAVVVDSKLEPPDTWTRRRTDDEEVAAISDEAEWLASGVELAFSPDGKKLVARTKAE